MFITKNQKSKERFRRVEKFATHLIFLSRKDKDKDVEARSSVNQAIPKALA